METVTAGGDCSHETERHLLLGRKVMTNLDSILKSRDITLSTMVHLVKAMVFPVVMYGYEIWTKKKDKRGRDEIRPRKGVLKKKFSNTRKHSVWWVCGEPWNLRGQNNQEEK